MSSGGKSISANPVLFYSLLGGCIFIALFLILLLCICLMRRKNSKKAEAPKISIQSPSGISSPGPQFTTDIVTQQVPLAFDIPSSYLSYSVPSSPSQSPLSRRSVSLDTSSFDLDMYKEEDDSIPGSPSFGLGNLLIRAHLNRKNKKLTVNLIKGARISSKYGYQAPSVYVKLYLVPHRRQKKHQSRTHKGNNPEFNEEFEFQLPDLDMDSRILKFVIFDYDRFSRAQVLGYAFYPLAGKKELLERKQGTGEVWIDMQAEEFSRDQGKGEILIGLAHLPTAGRITVMIMKGRNIPLTDKDRNGEMGVKVSLFSGGNPIKTKKAMAKGFDPSFPIFNGTFVFDISSEIVDRISFAFAICLYPPRGMKRVLGRIVIGPVIYTQGTGLEHWRAMLDSSRNTVTRWHDIT